MIFDMAHFNANDQQIVQVWVTEEAKRLALVTAQKRGMKLQEFVSRAILSYATQNKENSNEPQQTDN